VHASAFGATHFQRDGDEIADSALLDGLVQIGVQVLERPVAIRSDALVVRQGDAGQHAVYLHGVVLEELARGGHLGNGVDGQRQIRHGALLRSKI
jgi:hypothetical protein